SKTPDVVHGSQAPGCDHRNGNSFGKRQRRIPVDAGENAVAVNVGIDDGGNASAFELFREFDYAEFACFRPAFDSNLAALGVNANGNLSRKFLAGLDHQRRIAHSDRAEDDAAQPLGKPVLDMLERADAATE